MANSTVDTLNSITNGANVALALASVGIPLVKGIITEVKQLIGDNNQPTMDYQVILTISGAQLDEADKNYQETIDNVNAELTRLGQPTI